VPWFRRPLRPDTSGGLDTVNSARLLLVLILLALACSVLARHFVHEVRALYEGAATQVQRSP